MRRGRTAAAATAALLALGLAAGTAAGQSGTEVAEGSLLDPDFLLTVGWIVDPAAEPGEAILGSVKEGDIEDRTLTTFDRVFVPAAVGGRPLAVGDHVQFYRLPRAVAHPVSGAPLGRLRVPTAVGRVDSLTANAARVLLTGAFAAVQVGDRVRRVTAVDTTAAAGSAASGSSGIVVAFQTDKAVHPPYDRLFLLADEGSPAPPPGALVELFRPGEVVEGRTLPERILGRAVVVRSDGGRAAAVLVSVERSDLRVGDGFRAVAR